MYLCSELWCKVVLHYACTYAHHLPYAISFESVQWHTCHWPISNPTIVYLYKNGSLSCAIGPRAIGPSQLLCAYVYYWQLLWVVPLALVPLDELKTDCVCHRWILLVQVSCKVSPKWYSIQQTPHLCSYIKGGAAPPVHIAPSVSCVCHILIYAIKCCITI